MKLATWNVNGLRSTLRSGFNGWLRNADNDIVCLQEVKTQEDLLTGILFSGYTAYWYAANRSGYSGVVTLVRSGIKVVSIDKGIGFTDVDIEGRVLCVEFEKFHLINIYAPHSHRKLTRFEFKLEFCRRFTSYIEGKKHSGKPIIVAGDLNVAHTEKDLSNPTANKKNAGFLPEERQWLDFMLRHGFVDAFRLFCDEAGHYTWWSPIKGVRERNVGWRLDYILIDQALVRSLKACFHSPEQKGSDHCPVTVLLDL